MADEVAKGRAGLRGGLPRLLAEDPDKLNDLLGLTRQERLRIGTLVPKAVRARIGADLKSRPEPVRPGERDRVVVQYHYQHPQVRQAAWEAALEWGPGGKPSLEATVLAEFVEAARGGSRPPGESDTERTEAEWIADLAWADTRDRLARWDALEAEERERCVLRTFAVATVLDDATILTKAIDLAPGLADQFENLLPRETEKQEGSGSDRAEPASARWTALTTELKGLASRAAGPPPAPEVLKEIATVVESLQEIEPSLEHELSSEAFGRFLDEVRQKLDSIQADKALRLDGARRTALEQHWERCRGSLTGRGLEEERHRFETTVGETVEQVRMAARDLANAKQRIESHRAEEPDDPYAEEDWSDALEGLQKEERRYRRRHRGAHDALLTALSPRGEGFDIPPKPPPKPVPPKPPEARPAQAATEARPAPSQPPKPVPPKPPPKPVPPKPAAEARASPPAPPAETRLTEAIAGTSAVAGPVGGECGASDHRGSDGRTAAARLRGPGLPAL